MAGSPVNSYKYIDDPLMKMNLEINNDYNLFVRTNANVDLREKIRQKQLQDQQHHEEEKLE